MARQRADGSWGRVARLTVDAGNLPVVHLQLPDSGEQTTLYGDKSIAFTKTGTNLLDLP